jgi:methyl-accepting chemotaxis protein
MKELPSRKTAIFAERHLGDHVIMLNISLAGTIAHTLPHPLSALLVFQADTIANGQFKWLVIFVGIAAISLLILALVVLGAIFAGLKAQQELGGEIKKFRDDASQLIQKSNALIVEITPQIRQITAKVETITGHVEHLAALVHEKADEISPTVTAANQTVLEANATVRETIRTASATVQDANLKTRAQISRVDGIITSALNGAVRLGVAIEQGIAKPGREVAGVIAGLKAGVDVLAGAASRALSARPAPQRSTPPAPAPRSIYPVPTKSETDF